MSSNVIFLSNLTAFFNRMNPVILGPVICLVIILFIIFYVKYKSPANKAITELKKIILKLNDTNSNQLSFINASMLGEIFIKQPFNHLWKEYSDSLHEVISSDRSTSYPRATVPAEMYFTKESLIDNQINVDFFRHLPGIITGIGIIGTFAGLVLGLHYFNPNNAADSIPPLLREVGSAFFGSGFAIFVAILITIMEKFTLTRCYKLVEELQNKIDGLFATGAGEEYLARLVSASEKNSVHTAALKDALIEDLKTLMHEVAEKQIQAQAAQSLNVAEQISDAISTSLQGTI